MRLFWMKLVLVVFLCFSQIFSVTADATYIPIEGIGVEVPADLELQVFDTPTVRSGLDRASVRSDGWFAIASMNQDIHDDNTFSEKYIDLYDTNGTFIFALQFYTKKSVELELTEDSLDIYIWPNIISYDLNTKNASVYQTQMDQEETMEYFSNKRLEANGWEYRFTGFTAPHATFIRSNGSETQVLVETAGDMFSEIQLLVRSGIAFLVAVAVTFVYLRIKRKRKTD